MADALKKQFVAAMCAALLPHMAAAAPPGEYEVKAAFIHNIAKFVEWPLPPPADGKLRLCILGRGSFSEAALGLRGKPVGSQIWEVATDVNRANLRECRVIFVEASEAGNLRQSLDGIRGAAVLTVGDTRGYAEQGVMVNFYLEQNRVRFEINAGAARRAGLKIGSQLLRLGRLVAHQGSDK